MHRSKIWQLFTTEIDGIAVTSPERTMLEVSVFRSDHSVLRTLEDALIRGIVDLDRLVKTREIMRALGRRRFAVWTRLLPELVPELKWAGTSTEVRAIRAWQHAGMAIPTPQFRIIIDGHTRFLDFAYADEKIAIECDGFLTHDRLRAADDRKRDRWLVNHGWLVLRFPNSATNAEFVDDVRAALHQRSAAA